MTSYSDIQEGRWDGERGYTTDLNQREMENKEEERWRNMMSAEGKAWFQAWTQKEHVSAFVQER